MIYEGGVKLRWKELNGMMTDDSRSDPVSDDGSTLSFVRLQPNPNSGGKLKNKDLNFLKMK